MKKKGLIVQDRQKRCQYEEDSTYYRIEILEVLFPKCSLPNLWYDLDILTTVTEVHDRAPELLPLPSFSPLQTKLQKSLIQELNILCNCVINTWTLITAHGITGKGLMGGRAGIKTFVAAKFSIKNGYFFHSFQHFPCSKPICTFCSVKQLILAFKCERI